MFNIMTRFLMKRYFNSIAMVMLTVCGIIFTITFVERLPRHDALSGAVMDAWVRLLEYIPLFLPLAVFMGTLFASYVLTKSSENIIIASAGMSPYQSTRPFIIAAALIGIFTTTIVNPYTIELSSQSITAKDLKLVDDKIWIRESNDVGIITLSAENVEVNEKNLKFIDVVIYNQSPDLALINRIESNTMILSDDGLFSQSAAVYDSKGHKKNQSWQMDTLLNPQTVLDRYLQADQISFWKLPDFITKMKDIGAPIKSHLVQLWTLLFLPLTLISMTVLGVAFSQTKQRRNYSFGLKFGFGIITCFVLYFITNLFTTLGATGSLPTLLAVIAPPFIIIAIAGFSIISSDNI